MIDYVVYKDKAEEIHSDLNSIIKNSDMVNKENDALVLMTLAQDISGEVEIRAPVSVEMDREIRKSLQAENIGKDKFMVMCKGNYSFQERSVSIYCGIKNEDGIPVSLMNNFHPEIKKKTEELAEELLNVFYKK